LWPRDPLQGCQVGQKDRIEFGQSVVGEMSPSLRSALYQPDAVRIEEDRDQPADQVGPAADGLPVDTEPSASGAIQPELAGQDRTGLLLHFDGNMKVVPVEVDQLLGFTAAVGTAESQEIEGFQEIGLTFTISPQDKIDPGRKGKMQFLQIPESVNGCRQNPQTSRRPDARASTGKGPRSHHHHRSRV